MPTGGKRSRAPDIAGDVRAAFRRAILMRKEGKGRALSDIMNDLLDENPIGLLNAMGKFIPKEIDQTVTEMAPEDWLELMADRNDSSPEGQ